MEARLTQVAALTALALLSAAGVAKAPKSPTPIPPGHHVHYYEVSGSTLEELKRSLDQAAPIGPKGVRAYGLTEWHVSWDYAPRRVGHECRLLQVSTSLRTAMTLPRWTASDGAPASLVERWKRFIAGLEEHELGHVRNARAAEAAIAKALERVRSAPTCVATARAADRAALEVLWSYQTRDRSYDRETRYGREQFGAALTRD